MMRRPTSATSSAWVPGPNASATSGLQVVADSSRSGDTTSAGSSRPAAWRRSVAVSVAGAVTTSSEGTSARVRSSEGVTSSTR